MKEPLITKHLSLQKKLMKKNPKQMTSKYTPSNEDYSGPIISVLKVIQ